MVATSSSFTATNMGNDQINLARLDGNGNAINASSNVTISLSNSDSGFFVTTTNTFTHITTVTIPSGS